MEGPKYKDQTQTAVSHSSSSYIQIKYVQLQAVSQMWSDGGIPIRTSETYSDTLWMGVSWPWPWK